MFCVVLTFYVSSAMSNILGAKCKIVSLSAVTNDLEAAAILHIAYGQHLSAYLISEFE